MNLTRDLLNKEFDKMPLQPKTFSQKTRRKELEQELETINKKLASIRR